MLRTACSLMTEAGIKICAPIHDAVLIEAPLEDLETTVARARALMKEASEIVLGGFTIGTEAQLIRYPEQYKCEKGVEMAEYVKRALLAAGVQLSGGQSTSSEVGV